MQTLAWLTHEIPWVMAPAILIAATAAISIASYFIVEQPIRHGRLLRLELTPARTAAVSLVSVVMVLGVVGLAARTVEVPEWIAAA